MRTAVIGTLVVALAALAAGACGDRTDEGGAEALVSAEDEVEELDPALSEHLAAGTTFEMAEEGRRLYLVCAVCHGLDANGTALGSSLRDGEWTTTSGELAEIERVIREGVPEPEGYPVPMPVLGGGDFDAGQVRALAAYVYAVGHAAP